MSNESVVRYMRVLTNKNTHEPLFSFLISHSLILSAAFSGFFHEFAGYGFFLPVQDGGRLFKILPLFEFTNNAFFFHHTLEALDGFFK